MNLLGILIASLFLLCGLALIVGAYKRWDWLVDPPTNMWPFYSPAFLKKLFGTGFVVVFTYVVGFLLVLSVLWGLAVELLKMYR
jgi:drug/metabolite transporter superfamily protein YnfA